MKTVQKLMLVQKAIVGLPFDPGNQEQIVSILASKVILSMVQGATYY